ncbi:MAG TPA: hypothetical protein VGL75_13015 [Acidothermaceae bacterium]
MAQELQVVHGQPSWRVSTAQVEAFVTELGGQLGPVTFNRGKHDIRPFPMPPWIDEPLDEDVSPILRALRGDFFCLPFGANTTPYNGELHPEHGQPVHRLWNFESNTECAVQLSQETTIRQGRIDKWLELRPGHPALYQRHVISGMAGPMPLGHHAMVLFPDRAGSGVLSMSPFVHGQVFPGQFENPEQKGYSSLSPGALFSSLSNVPLAVGGETDLSRYPARRGFDDLVMLVSDDDLAFAWTAVVFADERFVWFALRDPRVLRSTVLWFSNGGRHASPWNGRHVNLMGIEHVTAYFHRGLAESALDNSIRQLGYPTALELDPSTPLVVNHIMGATAIPESFDRVAAIVPDGLGIVRLIADSGYEVVVPLDLAFLGTDAG